MWVDVDAPEAQGKLASGTATGMGKRKSLCALKGRRIGVHPLPYQGKQIVVARVPVDLPQANFLDPVRAFTGNLDFYS